MAAEGIALLSMYGDEEEEEEEEEKAAVVTEVEEAAAVTPAEDDGGENGDENPKVNYMNSDHPPPQSLTYKSPQPLISLSPRCSLDDADSKTLIRSPSPQQNPTSQASVFRSLFSSPFNLTSPSPLPALAALPSFHEHMDGKRPIRIPLAIVDYAQDEAVMSPDAEVMEIENNGRVILGDEIHVSDGKVEGTSIASQSLTPSIQQKPLQPFDAHEQFKSEASISMVFSGTESEVAEANASLIVLTDMQIDKLQNFLPPIVTTKCSEELQEKINKFIAYKRAGKSFNADLRNRKDYRNPNFLQHAVNYQDIDEIGTCFSKEVFDPQGYDKSDYYDEIEADMKRVLERKEQERKKSQNIDFVSSGSQPVGFPLALKMNASSPASGVSTFLNSSMPPNSTIGDASRDSRTNKKSKWDKIH